MTAFNIFTTLYNQFDVAFLAAVNSVLASTISYVRPLLLALTAATMAILLLIEIFDFKEGYGGNPASTFNIIFRAAIIVFVVSSVPVYNQWVGNLFTTTLPNDLANAVSGAVGGPQLNAAAFDHELNVSFALGWGVMKNVPWYSLKTVILGIIVIIYFFICMIAIGFAFLIYLASHVIGGLLVATGPIFLCCFTVPALARIFDNWLGALVGVALTQVFIVAILSLLVVTVGNEVNQLAGTAGAQDLTTQLVILVEAAFFMLVIAALALEASKWAAHIGAGVASSMRAATAVASNAAQVGGGAAAAVGGSVVNGIAGGASGRNPRPAGKVIG